MINERALRKFWTDPQYHALVEVMTAGLAQKTWSAAELDQAARLAAHKFSIRRQECETNSVISIPHGGEAKCERCGCRNESPCALANGEPCSWIVPGRLCSACATPAEIDAYMSKVLGAIGSDAELDEALEALEQCPGAGACHGPMKWCDICGDVSEQCDSVPCDVHKPITEG